MKQIFLFCKDAEQFNSETVVFRLSVGKSSREQTKCALLEQFANDCGYFMRKRDEDTDFWLLCLSKALRPDSQFPMLHVKQATMSVTKFYELIMSGHLDDYCKSLNYEKGTHKLISMLDNAYSFHKISKKKYGACANFSRKNLSQRFGTDWRDFVLCMIGLAGVMFLDAFISNLFNFH